jgi:hypothetical protein
MEDLDDWPIRWVGQEHSHGCAVACLAMVAGVSYADARKAWPDLPPEQPLGAYEAREWLKSRGYDTALTMAHFYTPDKTSWPPEPFAEVHLVSVSPHHGSDIGHEVVMLGNGTVLDPDTPGPRRLSDYGHVNSVTAVTRSS